MKFVSTNFPLATVYLLFVELWALCAPVSQYDFKDSDLLWSSLVNKAEAFGLVDMKQRGFVYESQQALAVINFKLHIKFLFA